MYLVTGGSGFCGFEIVKYLLQRSEQVRVIDLEPMPGPLGDVEFVKGDIRNESDVSRACAGIHCIIHAAAKVPISKAGSEFQNVNVHGTRNVLEAALKHQVAQVVHLSSSSVQVSDQNPVDENAPYHPIGDYAKSKVEAEELCYQYIEKGLDVDIIRPRTVVGVGRLGIFDILFDWITEGRKIYIIGKGKNKIQFLHVEDLAECCYLASRHRGNNVFNVGGKDYASLREDLESLVSHANTGSRVISLPTLPSLVALSVLEVLRLSPLTSWHYKTYYKDFYVSNEKAKSVLDWQPRFGNQEILKKAYDGYVQMKARGATLKIW